MKFIHRLGYYLSGFAIGLIFLMFFFNGKKTSCSYGPQARVIKNINTKPFVYKDSLFIKDSASINYVKRFGSVNFSKSETRKKPCGIFILEGKHNSKNIELIIKNCDSIATLLDYEKY